MLCCLGESSAEWFCWAKRCPFIQIQGTLDVHCSCTFLLNFGARNCYISFPKFCQEFRKNVSSYVAKTIAQCEISSINLEPGFPKCIAQHAIWNLIVIQIEGELKFIELEHAVLLLWVKWRILRGGTDLSLTRAYRYALLQKWKNLDPEVGRASLAPPLDPPITRLEMLAFVFPCICNYLL